MRLGRLSGLVPLVGVASGFCFAGNAALLGICDIIVATATANIGMAGPGQPTLLHPHPNTLTRTLTPSPAL